MAFAQSNAELSLHDALIQIAKQEKLSLVFNSENIPDKNVKTPHKDQSISQKLKSVLKGTELFFEINEDQIYLHKRHKIFGYIEDGTTGERLISASIFLPSDGSYDLSNADGFFTISTTKDSITLEASYLGYTSLTKKVGMVEMDRAITIALNPNNQLKEIIISDALVSDEQKNYIELNKGTDILLFNNQASSAIGGEPDIFQAMIRQAGVNAGTDGIGGIHVRGGRNDQNLILYDGVPLYQPNHAFGLFSIVNSSVIDQTRLYKSGANAALSGRLSAIMDIKTKDPDLKASHISVQASTLATQASIELPIIKNKLAVMLTGRRTHVDPFVGPLTEKELEEINTDFNFKDLSFKAYGKLDNKSRLYLSLYVGSDHFSEFQMDAFDLDFDEFYSFDSQADYNWSNQLATLRYNRILGKSSFVNVSLSRYEYKYDNQFLFNESTLYNNPPDFYARQFSGFEMGNHNTQFKLELETISKNHHFQYGLSANHRNYQIGTIIQEDLTVPIDNTMPPPSVIPLEIIEDNQYRSNELVVHLSDKWKAEDRLIFDAAIYGSYFTSQNLGNAEGFEYNAKPSHLINVYGYLKFQYKLSDYFHLGATSGRYIQTEHLINIGDNGYPNDTWLPSTEAVPPEISYQSEIFTSTKIDAHRFKVSAYYKTQSGLIHYDSLAELPTLLDILPFDWEDAPALGTSEGYGVEFEYAFVKKDLIEIKSIYSYGETRYKNRSLNNGLEFPFDFSIPHTISLGANFQLHKNLTFGLDWYFSSGRPYTYYNSITEYTPLQYNNPTELIQLSGYNDQRLPAAHKLNLSLSTSWKWNQVRSDLYLGVQNVYNRRNLIYRYEFDDPDFGIVERDQGGFPILPMLRWRLSI